jgi:hypothetical protein
LDINIAREEQTPRDPNFIFHITYRPNDHKPTDETVDEIPRRVASAYAVVGWPLFQIETAYPFGLVRLLTIFSASIKLPAAS